MVCKYEGKLCKYHQILLGLPNFKEWEEDLMNLRDDFSDDGKKGDTVKELSDFTKMVLCDENPAQCKQYKEYKKYGL